MEEQERLRNLIGADVWDYVDTREVARMALGAHRAVWRDQEVWFVCPSCKSKGRDKLNVKVNKSGFWCFDHAEGGNWFEMLGMLGVHGNECSMRTHIDIRLADGHPENTPERNALHVENARRILLMYVTK